MKLVCNNKTVELVDNTVVVICEPLGTSTFGNGDLYDLGFTVVDLESDNLVIQVGNANLVIECKKMKQERLIRQFMDEMMVSETGARIILRNCDWHYGRAKMHINMMRHERGQLKPCGEIPLNNPQSCNLQPMTAEDVYAKFKAIGELTGRTAAGNVRPMFVPPVSSYADFFTTTDVPGVSEGAGPATSGETKG